MRHQAWLTRRPRAYAAALLPVLLLIAGCTSGASSQPNATATDSTAAEPVDSFMVVAYQGDEVLGGEEVAFDSLLGQGRPVVLNFWAAQCPPCRAEMPWFEAVWQRYQDQVLLVGIDVGPFIQLGSNEQGARLLEELAISYPAVYAIDDRSLRRFEVLGMPTTVFFDQDGQVIGKHTGIMAEHEIEERFRELAEGAD